MVLCVNRRRKGDLTRRRGAERAVEFVLRRKALAFRRVRSDSLLARPLQAHDNRVVWSYLIYANTSGSRAWGRGPIRERGDG